MILTIPNILSFLRVPLALTFLSQTPFIRITAVILAIVSDVLDGYLARRYRQASLLGTILDPLTDKFFMIFVFATFFYEGRLEIWQIVTLLSRDFAVALFGIYLTVTGGLGNYKLRAILAGKVSTSLQFIVLLALLTNISVPFYIYYTFVPLGVLALLELGMWRVPIKMK